jgi:hypothetical protein
MMKKYFLAFFILAVGFGFYVTNVFAYDDTESSSPLRGVETDKKVGGSRYSDVFR